MEWTATATPGLIGGALIGLSSALLLLTHGRIAGISGILGQSMFDRVGADRWRYWFLLGLPLGAWVAAQAGVEGSGFTLEASPGRLVVAGLLVGLGTQLGNGCTSGHGVCGVGRGSRRSIVATGVFMAIAAAVVFVTRHVLGGQ